MSSLDVRAVETTGVKKETFPAVEHEFRVRLAEAAFDRAVARGSADTSREVGGVLVGRVLADDAGPYVLVDATIDALHADEQGAELTFTHATWDHINREMDAEHAGKRIVGWYHTHPGFGIFLSDRDQFIQKSFFNLPFQIALVYDPKSREHGVFAWRENEPWRLRRYWIGRREQSWDGPRQTMRATTTATAALAPPDPVAAGPPRPPASADAWMIGVAALACLLVGGFGGWLLGGRGADAAVQNAQLKAQVDGAQAVAAMLNPQLLAALREALVTDLGERSAYRAGEALDRALLVLPESLPNDPRVRAARADVSAARDALSAVHGDRLRAAAIVERLEQWSRVSVPDLRELAQDVARERFATGQLLLQSAEGSIARNDTESARRLLVLAADVDPSNVQTYEAALRKFDKDARLQPRAAESRGAPGAAVEKPQGSR